MSILGSLVDGGDLSPRAITCCLSGERIHGKPEAVCAREGKLLPPVNLRHTALRQQVTSRIQRWKKNILGGKNAALALTEASWKPQRDSYYLHLTQELSLLARKVVCGISAQFLHTFLNFPRGAQEGGRPAGRPQVVLSKLHPSVANHPGMVISEITLSDLFTDSASRNNHTRETGFPSSLPCKTSCK